MTLLAWLEHPTARAEYVDALAWYDAQEVGLGDRLADDLDAGVDFVRAWPDAAPPYSYYQRVPLIRRKSTDVFPFSILYFIFEGLIVIVAYAHEKRRPGYWRHRLQDL